MTVGFTVSQRPDHLWQCDLAYFHYGKQFILIKVDTFSRLADAEVVDASSPTDRRGQRIRFCDENGIEHFNTNSDTKASVEWFNRTLGTLLARRVRFDKGISLQRAVRTEIDHYNRRPSSVFGFRWSPRQVHDDDDAPDPALVWPNDRRV